MAQTERPKVIVICGPTGIGKTELSLALAEAFGGSIVSADSMQIYRYMDIGTAKPDASERLRVHHYMIDVADPDEAFDAARFCREGRQAVARIRAAGNVPFVVGGTGFYIRALLHGLFESPPVVSDILQRLKAEAADNGIAPLYRRLSVFDPAAAARIHPNDAYRVIRALLVCESTGMPVSAIRNAHGFQDQPFDALCLCLSVDRDVLYERIDRRVDAMLRAGLLEEVKGLLDRGYASDLRPMQAIGYRHMADIIEGRMGREEAVDLLKRDTRRFAKRQLTWFRREPDLAWVDPLERSALTARIHAFLNAPSVPVK